MNDVREKYELILEIQGHSAVDADELNVKYEIIYFIFENDNEKITASFCVFNKQHISMDVNGLHQYLQFKVNNIERQYKNKDFKSLNGFVEILIFIEFELIDRCCRLYF